MLAKSLSLIVAQPSSEGLVVGSDSQLTAGFVRQTAEKIRPLNPSAIWAAVGELALIQRAEEHILGLTDKTKPLAELRDDLARAIGRAVQEVLELDVRSVMHRADPDGLLGLHPADFLFAEYRQNGHGFWEHRLLHIETSGTAEWVSANRPFATGSGSIFAYALLQRYERESFNLQQAALLTYRAIAGTIATAAEGIGVPISLWQLDQRGWHQYGDGQIRRLERRDAALRKRETAALRETAAQDQLFVLAPKSGIQMREGR